VEIAKTNSFIDSNMEELFIVQITHMSEDTVLARARDGRIFLGRVSAVTESISWVEMEQIVSRVKNKKTGESERWDCSKIPRAKQETRNHDVVGYVAGKSIAGQDHVYIGSNAGGEKLEETDLIPRPENTGFGSKSLVDYNRKQTVDCSCMNAICDKVHYDPQIITNSPEADIAVRGALRDCSALGTGRGVNTGLGGKSLSTKGSLPEASVGLVRDSLSEEPRVCPEGTPCPSCDAHLQD